MQAQPQPQQQHQQQQMTAKYNIINNNLTQITNSSVLNNNNPRLDSSLIAATAAAAAAADYPPSYKRQSSLDATITDTLISNSNNNLINNNNLGSAANRKSIIKRNSSLINFKSLDISLKSIYSNFRNNKSSSKTLDFSNSNVGLHRNQHLGSGESTKTNRTPYLKVEPADQEPHEETALLTYHQSPGGYRGSIDRQSKIDLNYLTTAGECDLTRSQSSSPFLSISPQTERRSSTSDIIGKKGGGGQGSGSSGGGTGESRRTSTTDRDMLRKARERKNSGGRLGRSMSHGGLGMRGGMRGGRRTSMAF